MDRRFLRNVRTKSGERGCYHAGVGVGRQVDAPAQDLSMGAYYHPREQTKPPKVELCSTSSEDSTTEDDLFFHDGRLCKKIDEAPMNKITNEVVSRIVEKRRSSSSVIARLMGLDELHPPQEVVSETKNETGHFLLKKSFAGLGEKYECSGNQSFHVSRRQHRNLMIVHDHFDSSKAKKHIDNADKKEKQNSKPDIAFIKQQFIEAKSLSTTEAHKNSKEFRDAINSMDANKDIFMKIVQEPNSLFAKHFHGLKHSKSSSHINHINILESSAGKNETFYRSVEETKVHTRKKKDTAHCGTKPRSSLYSHYTCDHVDSLLPKLLRSQYREKTETSRHPNTTSIVVLKPSIQKGLNTGRIESIPGYLQNYKLCRRHREFQREFLVERGEKYQLFDIKTKECYSKATNDIASDISKQVKQSLRSYSEELLTKTDKYNSLSTYLSEPFQSREAMMSLSEQWKTTSPSRQRLVGEGSSTLGEILSLSDKETPKTLGQLILKNKSDKRVDEEDVLRFWAYPSGISSNDGWKDGCDDMLLRSEDQPNSSVICMSLKPDNRRQVGCTNSVEDCYMLKDAPNLERNDLHNSIIERGHSLLRNLKYHDNKPRLFRSCGAENKRPAREVEVCQDESRNMINLNNLVEPKPIYLHRKVDDLLHLVCNSSNPQNLNSYKSFLTDLKEFQQSAKFNDLSVILLEKEVQEIASVDFPLVESTMDVIRESGALISPKVTGRLSPVSVLEPPSEYGKSTPQILERIGASLQDLQRQLNLLELETVDSCDEQSKSLIFNDEASRKIFKSLKKGGERDFLYLLDILTASGIYSSSQNKFFDACYSPDNPVFPDVFDKLENEYNMINSWSRSERKLLFDHINSILAEVLAPCMDLHPWVKLKRSTYSGNGRLVDESWRLLVRQRKELGQGKPEEKVLDTSWLYIDDHVDMIGREIERMLKDDLLNELVSEFVLV